MAIFLGSLEKRAALTIIKLWILALIHNDFGATHPNL
jgi:hypothetical protein